jgi:hypothetical protein
MLNRSIAAMPALKKLANQSKTIKKLAATCNPPKFSQPKTCKIKNICMNIVLFGG